MNRGHNAEWGCGEMQSAKDPDSTAIDSCIVQCQVMHLRIYEKFEAAMHCIDPLSIKGDSKHVSSIVQVHIPDNKAAQHLNKQAGYVLVVYKEIFFPLFPALQSFIT